MKDEVYQKAVDLEIDRISRLNACDLMKVEEGERNIEISGHQITVYFDVKDWGDTRHIGVLATKKLFIGYRKFYAGMLVELESRRITDKEASELYG